MRRLRKVLDRASVGKEFSPLVDIHTGNIGPSSPSAVSYLSHFPYADSAWNGEGFNFDLDPAYWLVDVSGFIHGIPCDRLGGPDSIKGMLFGNYQRNSASAEHIWSFWDSVSIQDTAMVGWWEDDAPVSAVVPSPPPAPPSPVPPSNKTCEDTFKSTPGAYIDSPGYSHGAIGFGADCGPPGSNKKYPELTVAEAKAACCALGDGCVGFSWKNSNPVGSPGSGCFQKTNGGTIHEANYTGYEKHCSGGGGGGGGNCSSQNIKTTTYVDYGKRAVVVIASWCPSSTMNVSLKIDWDALGLEAATANVSQPAIVGVQSAADHGRGDGFLSISGAVNGGAMLVIEPERQFELAVAKTAETRKLKKKKKRDPAIHQERFARKKIQMQQ